MEGEVNKFHLTDKERGAVELLIQANKPNFENRIKINGEERAVAVFVACFMATTTGNRVIIFTPDPPLLLARIYQHILQLKLYKGVVVAPNGIHYNENHCFLYSPNEDIKGIHGNYIIFLGIKSAKFIYDLLPLALPERTSLVLFNCDIPTLQTHQRKVEIVEDMLSELEI